MFQFLASNQVVGDGGWCLVGRTTHTKKQSDCPERSVQPPPFFAGWVMDCAENFFSRSNELGGLVASIDGVVIA